jgi:hypothetical protein
MLLLVGPSALLRHEAQDHGEADQVDATVHLKAPGPRSVDTVHSQHFKPLGSPLRLQAVQVYGSQLPASFGAMLFEGDTVRELYYHPTITRFRLLQMIR